MLGQIARFECLVSHASGDVDTDRYPHGRNSEIS